MIDVWNVETFDQALLDELDAQADLIREYLEISRQHEREREASKPLMVYPENPHAGAYLGLKERLMPLMNARIIRCWHYSRMTDAEIDDLARKGMQLSTLGTIRSRLRAQVQAGAMTQEVADRIFADSPFQGDQQAARTGKFWMVSNPLDPMSSGVKPLLGSWGGEAAYFWQQDPALQQLLASIGRPRVLEIAMPLAYSRHSYRAAESVVAAYARTLGCRIHDGGFDLYSEAALNPESLLAVHSEGDDSFARLACGYPADYLSVESDGNLG